VQQITQDSAILKHGIRKYQRTTRRDKQSGGGGGNEDGKKERGDGESIHIHTRLSNCEILTVALTKTSILSNNAESTDKHRRLGGNCWLNLQSLSSPKRTLHLSDCLDPET
jgi:hypothetical protein